MEFKFQQLIGLVVQNYALKKLQRKYAVPSLIAHINNLSIEFAFKIFVQNLFLKRNSFSKCNDNLYGHISKWVSLDSINVVDRFFYFGWLKWVMTIVKILQLLTSTDKVFNCHTLKVWRQNLATISPTNQRNLLLKSTLCWNWNWVGWNT